MTDRPEERPEERRGTGPLGDDANETTERETRREPAREAHQPDDVEATRQVPVRDQEQRPDQESGREPSPDDDPEATQAATPLSRRDRRRGARDEREEGDKETRVIRAPGSATAAESSPYPRGYFEAAEEREDRLRDMYGGVDWLASFLGFVFAAVAAAVLSAIAGLILMPLGFAPDLGSGELGPAVITGLVLLAILFFLTFFFGGYVAGRLARFDGVRNGAMTVLWAVAVGVVIIAVSGFLPGSLFDSVQNFMQTSVLPVIGDLSSLGIIGIVIVVVIALIALAGGLVGGRLGSRYHSEIDRTT